jgi:hypothetical protein
MPTPRVVGNPAPPLAPADAPHDPWMCQAAIPTDRAGVEPLCHDDSVPGTPFCQDHQHTGTAYLDPDQVGFLEVFYGVPVCWVGEDGDVLALTADWRRGAAAIHRLIRRYSGYPARTAGLTTTRVRFLPATPEQQTDEVGGQWTYLPCAPGDPGGTPAVLALQLSEYQSRAAFPRRAEPEGIPGG